MFEKWELRMKRPRARAGLTPISSSVRIVDAPAAVGVGRGDPCSIGGGGAGGDDGIARIDAVSGPLVPVPGRGSNATPPAGEEAGTWAVAERRCGRRAINARSSRTVCGRCAGSLARTLCRRTSRSFGRVGVIFTAEGIGVFTVA